ncbi:NADH-quinone oxidoreductase subunit D [Leptospira congkakensis]|uniref:NADH-quinone oxidoreductase subunit D n=1 Tax=Leptospira congkakensis TaxID=2484932 RepID=A0A4Z1A955_9LEPT|nr:FAD-dependent oxidoreductase [Leptospira congkakensis]TGL87941.1 NADH-quinone oxidoreductase subunit D [Leptospira congkakensis]TGL92718.1 NADH-quinone oxidoreductase subunit D [Leptospira congkakensis]TGL96091.1 NADH-quinone oxidoreductase subunit D [Leptospira congkakensis]
MKAKILILGAGYAGIIAANRLDKQVKDSEITVISESSLFQERIRFHEIASGGQNKEWKVRNLLRTNVNFLQNKVTRIFPKEKRVTIEGTNQSISYDYLVITLGSSQIRKITKNENSIQSKDAVDEFLKNKTQTNIQNLCIVGSGLTGIEMATEWKYFHPQGEVTIIDRNSFASSFSKKGQTYLKSYLSENGIRILDQMNIEKIEGNEIEIGNKTKLSFDSIINCTGFQTPPILKESGFRTNSQNQIYVDPFLRSLDFPEVFVAGDSAYLENSILRMGCVTALPMGAYVADHLANLFKGKNLSPFSFQFAGRCVSLGRNVGMIQLTEGNDKPKEMIIKGKWGALVKELVCKYTLVSLILEKKLPFRFYLWPKGNPIQEKIKSVSKPMPVGDLAV